METRSECSLYLQTNLLNFFSFRKREKRKKSKNEDNNDEDDDVQWSVDVSSDAIKARRRELLPSKLASLVINEGNTLTFSIFKSKEQKQINKQTNK